MAKAATEKPKKPLSAFFHFMAERRTEMAAQKSSLDHKEKIKQISSEWNSLPEVKKEKFTAMAAKAKLQYAKDIAAYEAAKPADEPSSPSPGKRGKKGGKGSKKAAKKEGQPKKPMSAYFFYIKERREALKKEQPELGNKEIISVMGKEWGKLSDKDKKKYADMHEKDKLRFKKEMDKFEAKEAKSDEADTKEKESDGEGDDESESE